MGMSIEQIETNLKLMAAEIEWEYPIDHQATIEEAVDCLDKLKQIKEVIHEWNIDITDNKSKAEYFDAILEVFL